MVETGRYFATYRRKPFWVTEYGGPASGSTTTGLEADLHAGIWSSWMTHAVGTPLLWWYDVIDHRNLYGHFRGFASFVQGEDRRKLDGTTAALPLRGDTRGLQSLQYRWSDGAYAWIYDVQAMVAWPDERSMPRHQEVKISIGDLAAGAYRVEFWDTLTGQITGTQLKELKVHEVLTLDLPPFGADLAIKVKRHLDTPPASGYQPTPEPIPFIERGEKPPSAPGAQER